jgi:hypothetical protein
LRVAVFLFRDQYKLGKEKLFVHPKLMTLFTRDSTAFELYR